MKAPKLASSGDGRDTRWDEHRSARHERLLAAALELIDREGGDVGVAAIAAEAEIPRSVVYRLFRDRDDLDEQIRGRIIDDLMRSISPALAPSGTIREAVRAAIETYVDWVTRHPHLHLFLSLGSATRRSVGSRAVTGTKTAIALNVSALISATLLSRGEGAEQPQGTADNLAFGLVGLVDSVVNRWVAHPESRSTAEALGEFLTNAACALIETTARAAGTGIGLDDALQ
ncbi:TetR/AcrR family transcriptional regulator [Amycolatopsis echigonensis]|uniref:TetR/AcrR family transcriptional regulator n=1 Tax=Amycolatopsis echigonensis TaxID=2576905 RepID=A0A8E2B3C7_9PSEU|nr:TetR/AcrR family transcriptional regulator [Amycolatopsis echigonensis]MBB2500566.1 TetR/AcrR family transcriptional regulator [Amycolatopsis echigonensis]